MKSLETFLTNKNYLFGAKPTVEDAVIFSFTTQIAYHDNGPLNEFFFSKKFFKKLYLLLIILLFYLAQCPNLLKHMFLIKNAYWPDWNERVKEVIEF